MYGDPKEFEDLEHGVVVVATGAEQYTPREYYYGQDARVITQNELEQRLFTDPNLNDVKSVVMIQCVGSRNAEHPYCSRVCCVEAIKNALRLKELNPAIEVAILFRDIRTYGLREKYYRKAREMGVQFVRFDELQPPEAFLDGNDLSVAVRSPDEDLIRWAPDLLVLSAGIVAPREENEILAKMLKVPLNEDGFFLEAHVKLRPVDFATEGVFLCGLAHNPKGIEDSISQALATVSRAAIYLSQDRIEAEGVVSVVKPTECVGCGICVKNCAYNAVELQQDPELGKIAVVNSALCKGCGLCAATCPQQAIVSLHHTTEQILSQINVLMEGK
jgi:heterodisulfide reductase subunit A